MTRSHAILIGLFIALMTTTSALAQEKTFNYELTPYGAYRFGGEFTETDGDISIELDDSSSYGLIFNARHSSITQWEIIYARQETQADTSGLGMGASALDLNIEHLQGGGTYLWDGDHVRPFLSATVGVSRIDVTSDGFKDDSFFSFSMGLGLQVRPTERLGIRLEARGFGTLLDSESDIFCRTGPDNNICAARIDGTVMWQLEAMAGLVFRF